MSLEEEITASRAWLRCIARRYYKEKMDIEDLVSETICKALANKDKYNREKPVKPWLEAIMQNTYITSYNRSQIVGFIRADVSWSAVSDSDTGSAVAVREIKEAVNRCRNRSCCIEALIKYMEGYSYDEISAMFSIPPGTVKSRISTARTMIRKELDL